MNYRGLFTSPLGFLIGLSLGALGGGGSILAVPALVYAAGQNPKEATATSLLLVGFASLVGLIPHLQAHRVRVGLGLMFGAAGIPGSLLGSALNKRMDPDVLLLAFSALILVAAWRMVTGCPSCTRIGEADAIEEDAEEELAAAMTGMETPGLEVLTRRPVRRPDIDVARVVAIIGAGSAVGFLTGLFGVGGGFVIVPALTLLLGLSMPVAIGTSLLVITVNSAVALTTRLATTTIDWGVTLPFTLSAVLGVLAGGKLADRLPAGKSLRWFAALLVAVAIYTGVNAVVGLSG